ncbi:MAG: PadR family transcriptional regulator [Rhodospirillaceae bacterium]|jgi:DNA-binding PadR family transcriptional regulator|nr:PadR family transcriptional regulator [Rhodospirillaceae bacterium]MBT5944514.1 PadR family transcriptional regulator [Rhodospirillaceae bacterium]MBT6405623.1 PadR family transcriptional regulator [Rhodospirillaceae bacterium]MBT6537177.1 PadR family transcriptional regulator [Rhodospirillaceae bacterium]MBT7361817.1 PadR family transcriptional regulator [Rhodospirillaceae bacterium]
MDAKTVCLAVLSQGEASGYEIRKSVEEGPFGHIQDIGFSSIYPALSRLRGDGLVTVTELAQEGRPDKKIYRLTSDGRLALLNALQDPTESDRVRSDFLFRMLFADILPPSIINSMIDARMEEIQTSLTRLGASASGGFESVGEEFVNGFAATVQRAMAAYIEDNRHQLVAAALAPSRAVAE